MDELLMRRYMKEVMKQGVPKYMAQEIVEVAIETGKGTNVDMYIGYAMQLVYGFRRKEKKISTE